MPSVHETAYPRLRASITAKDLAEVYTPTAEEISQASILAQGFTAKLCFLVLLKTFQRLGYFALLRDVPEQIITHIANSVGGLPLVVDTEAYDTSGTRRRHVAAIRRFLKVKAYGTEAKQVISDAVRSAAETKEDLADIINVAIEELVRHNFELPAFGTLHDEAQSGRAEVNKLVYTRVASAVGNDGCRLLDRLLEADDTSRQTPWQTIKEDVGAPTVNHLRELVKNIEWLKTQNVGQAALASIPESKSKQFAGEAKSLDASRMKAMEPAKRYTLAAALIGEQLARGLDDVGEMFIKRMTRIHNNGRGALIDFRKRHHKEVDEMVVLLLDLLTDMQQDSTAEEKIAAMSARIGIPVEDAIAKCQAYAAYANDNYMPFLWKFYKSSRATLFSLLDHVDLVSTSQDNDVFHSLEFLRFYVYTAGVTSNGWTSTAVARMVRRWCLAGFQKSGGSSSPVSQIERVRRNGSIAVSSR